MLKIKRCSKYKQDAASFMFFIKMSRNITKINFYILEFAHPVQWVLNTGMRGDSTVPLTP